MKTISGVSPTNKRAGMTPQPRRPVAVTLGLLLLLQASGCVSRRVADDLTAMRLELIRLNDDQIIDNAIRTRYNEPLLHVRYTKVTGNATWQLTNTGSFGNENDLNFDSSINVFTDSIRKFTYGYQLSAQLTGGMTVEGSPITMTDFVQRQPLGVASSQVGIPEKLHTAYQGLWPTLSGPFLVDDQNPIDQPIYCKLSPRAAICKEEWEKAITVYNARHHIGLKVSEDRGKVVYYVLEDNKEAFKTRRAEIAWSLGFDVTGSVALLPATQPASKP